MATNQNDSNERELFDDDSSGAADSIGHIDLSSTTGDTPKSDSGSSAEDCPANNIAKDETAAVFRLRVIVIVVLMITAAVVSAVVLRSAQSGEMDEFTTQFSGAAHMVQSAFNDVSAKLSVVSALAVVNDGEEDSLTDELRGKNWPFKTLQNFKERATNARYLSGVMSISVCPLVNVEDREQWELYVNGPESAWIPSSMGYQQQLGLNNFETNEDLIAMSYVSNTTVDPIKHFDAKGQAHLTLNDGPYLPVWQTSPLLQRRLVNENVLSRSNEAHLAISAIELHEAVIGGFVSAPFGEPSHSNPATSMFATYASIAEENSTHYLGEPMSYFYIPIFDSPNMTTRTAKAVLQSIIDWRVFFREVLKASTPPVVVVLDNTCGDVYTYEIQGEEAYILGFGDQHDIQFDQYEHSATFKSMHLRDGTVSGVDISEEFGCIYKIRIYPTPIFIGTYLTDTPLAITFAIAVVFVFTICMFVLYDRLVEQRQSIVMAQAAHTTAIVSSLFPKNVRDRLLATGDRKDGSGSIFSANKSRLKGFLDDGGNAGQDDGDKPIADLFPECTVFFADIAGFTAWSSTREPEQVFILLQTVYQKFDILAKRRKVFKVETIGDSYMAVTGLPEPMVNHAVTMVRFAWDCRHEFHRVTKELESSLGPDTGDLSMRFGLHSGPVTAGVLRGDRARFQLFGDTVNTASRMESTGLQDRVQVSNTTAELLVDAGKASWLKQREDTVHAKGKGVLVTYWAKPEKLNGSSTNSGSDADGSEEKQVSSSRERSAPVNQRLVDWVADLLLEQTRKVVHARGNSKDKGNNGAPTYYPMEGTTCMDEVREQIEMPSFDAEAMATNRDYRNVMIDGVVVANLREYVNRIAQEYRNNPFHNFEHACHVTMSVNKLLKRIVTPELSHEQLQRLQKVDDLASHLHDYTHGINSDPLLALAITMSALIHDVDHRGVSNTRLMVEQPAMASKYHNKSVAEQHSLTLAWNILMSDEFDNLRAVLFPSQFELMRFRQLIVNVVLATDIMDKQLNDLRRSRWERAFADGNKDESQKDTNLRANIVIEHIIQASDVSHTMQHWHVYRKWNERLFEEVYKGYIEGRMDIDPSEGWYKGELGFFDFYIIPLAKKLKECGVFGVSSDEYLNYALQNRDEWERKGETLVAEMLEKVRMKDQ